MSSQSRTALVGLGVLAVCLAMASLKGHHLLMAFAGASLLGAIYTWMQHSRKSAPIQNRDNEVVTRRVRSSRAAATSSLSNVYTFPANSWNVSDASS
ncbi:MAG: hypothetical protein K2X27_25910 [Candidatus Obscuribacterales bacterium]|nr:hypothetical protein [Candidatus Obscuribacterales bacterium]